MKKKGDKTQSAAVSSKAKSTRRKPEPPEKGKARPRQGGAMQPAAAKPAPPAKAPPKVQSAPAAKAAKPLKKPAAQRTPAPTAGGLKPAAPSGKGARKAIVPEPLPPVTSGKPAKAQKPVAPPKPKPEPTRSAMPKRAKEDVSPTPSRRTGAEAAEAPPGPTSAAAAGPVAGDAEPGPAVAAQPGPAPRTAAAKAGKKPAKQDDDDKALVKFDPLQRYLSEISRYKLLTREEERALGIRVMEEGDKDAAYVLVTANLRLVVKIALEFQRVWMQNLLDLIQEGNIGLMQAVKKFDPYKNVKFSYYASFWIKAYILKFIMDNWRLVKIGTTQGQRKLFFKLKKEKQLLIEQGFDPKPKLLSERLGVSEREIVDMDQRLDSWDVSLDAPVKNDSETERIEFISTESESVEEQVSKKEIELLLRNKIGEFRKKMSPREIEIFELRIFSDNPVTLQEIGDRYGISRERVRQIEKNIIRKIREFFKSEIPDFASYSEDADAE